MRNQNENLIIPQFIEPSLVKPNLNNYAGRCSPSLGFGSCASVPVTTSITNIDWPACKHRKHESLRHIYCTLWWQWVLRARIMQGRLTRSHCRNSIRFGRYLPWRKQCDPNLRRTRAENERPLPDARNHASCKTQSPLSLAKCKTPFGGCESGRPDVARSLARLTLAR